MGPIAVTAHDSRTLSHWHGGGLGGWGGVCHPVDGAGLAAQGTPARHKSRWQCTTPGRSNVGTGGNVWYPVHETGWAAQGTPARQQLRWQRMTPRRSPVGIRGKFATPSMVRGEKLDSAPEPSPTSPSLNGTRQTAFRTPLWSLDNVPEMTPGDSKRADSKEKGEA